MSNDDIIGSRQAAELMGMSVSHFTRNVRAGNIEPAHKLPGLRGAYMFDRALIERMAKETAR